MVVYFNFSFAYCSSEIPLNFGGLDLGGGECDLSPRSRTSARNRAADRSADKNSTGSALIVLTMAVQKTLALALLAA